MEGQVAGQNADRDGQDEPEGPLVADEAALAEASGQVDGAGHGGDVDDDVEQHQFVAYEDPVGKESGHDERHDGQPAQDGRTEFPDVAPGHDEVQGEQQHRIEHHLHMCHHALLHRENVPQEAVEEGNMVHKVHAGADNGQQDDGGDGFPFGHGRLHCNCKEMVFLLQPGCKNRYPGGNVRLWRISALLSVVYKTEPPEKGAHLE